MAKKRHSVAARPGATRGFAIADDRASNILGALVLLASATSIVPAFAEGSPDLGRSVAVLLVASGWLVAWAGGLLTFSKQQRLWLAGLAAVSAALIASSLFSRFPLSQLLGGFGTKMGAVQWIALVVIAAGVSAVKLGRRSRRWIAAVYVWVVPVALVGIGQVLLGRAVTGGFVNDDLFALVLLAWLAPAVGLAATSRDRREAWAWLAAAAAIALAIGVSRGRAESAGALIEAGLVVALIAPVLVPARRAVLRAVGFAVAGVVSAGLVALAVAGTAGLAVDKRLVSAFGPTLDTRFLLYQGAVRAIAKAPVLGVGPDGYQYAAQRFIQPALMAVEHGSSIVDVTPSDPHSIVLRALVGLGLVGTAALVVAVVGWFVAIRRAAPPTPRAEALRDSFLIGAVGFAAAALFAPWPVTIGASPVVVIGLAASLAGPGERLGEVPAAVRWVVAAVLSAVMVWVGVAGIVQYDRFLQAVAAPSPEARVAALDRAVSAAPWNEETRFQAIWARGVMVEEGSGDVAAFQRAVDADPLVSGYAPLLAEFVRQSLAEAVLARRTDLSWERRTLDRAAALAPGIPEVAAERLHLALVGGDPAQIAQAAAQAKGRAEPDRYYHTYVLQAAQTAAP